VVADKTQCIIWLRWPAMTLVPSPAEMAIRLVASARASSWGRHPADLLGSAQLICQDVSTASQFRINGPVAIATDLGRHGARRYKLPVPLTSQNATVQTLKRNSTTSPSRIM